MSGQEQQQSPFDIITFEGFTGLNTESARPAIKDQEMAWCDGWMPVGDSTLRTIPGIGAGIFYSGVGRTIEFFDFFNIGADPYALSVLSDGSVWISRTDNPSIFSEVAPPGTIISPIRQNVGITQWGSFFAIMVASQENGYFIIDGANFYKAGGIAPTTTASILNGGIGYSVAPSYTVFGGTGSGVVLNPVVSGGSLISLEVVNPGSGYSPGDVVQVAFSGGGSNNSPILVAAITGGVLTGVAVVNGGTNFVAPPPLTISGGGGLGATAKAILTAGVITSVSITAGGAGYVTTPAVIVAPGYNTAAYAALDLMPIGLGGGTAVETYQGRVWVASGTTMMFSAPESYTDFSTANGGGAFQSSDSFLRVNYIKPVQTNGFLYLIADSSVNYIGGVNTSGSPPVTTFTNQNANPEVGTPFAATVDIVGSNIVFANAFGAHVSYGGNVTKISAPLNGVFNTVPNFGGFNLSAAKHILYGRRVWVLLVPIVDPITNTTVNKLFMWDEKKWWSTNQDVNIIYIQSQEVNSIIQAYGTDGQNIYPLFTTPSVNFSKTARSKLWAKPGSYMELKSSNRAWLLSQYNTTDSTNVIFDVDNETSTSSVTISPSGAGLTTGYYLSTPNSIGQVGNLLGMTIQTSEADMLLISASIDAVPVGYRG